MEKAFDTANKNDVSGLPFWAIGAVLLGGVLLALPAYLDAMGLQILDNAFLSSLCGFVGWSPPAR
ncbi:MAG: hypothetical protein WD075_15455 [Rhodospirillales bacterium]